MILLFIFIHIVIHVNYYILLNDLFFINSLFQIL